MPHAGVELIMLWRLSTFGHMGARQFLNEWDTSVYESFVRTNLLGSDDAYFTNAISNLNKFASVGNTRAIEFLIRLDARQIWDWFERSGWADRPYILSLTAEYGNEKAYEILCRLAKTKNRVAIGEMVHLAASGDRRALETLESLDQEVLRNLNLVAYPLRARKGEESVLEVLHFLASLGNREASQLLEVNAILTSISAA